MSKLNCDVVKDLLPSYIDKICSEESVRLVDEHLRECEECVRTKEQMEESLNIEKLMKEELDLVEIVRSRKQKRHMIYIGIIILAITVNIIMTLFVEYNLVSYPLHFLLLPATILSLHFLVGGKAVKGKYKLSIIGHSINLLGIGYILVCSLQMVSSTGLIYNDGKRLQLVITEMSADMADAMTILLIVALSALYVSLLFVIRFSINRNSSFPGLLCETVTGLYMVWTFISVLYQVQLLNIIRRIEVATILVLPAEGLLSYIIIRKLQKRKEKKGKREKERIT